jgi:ABC-type uncharacterized transport system involved in gliding motility auxiliary subunit/ABC-type transport system involved in multi-copper enzyme maturation permease subunit
MKSVWVVARRELKALFDHPTGYILLVVFLVVNDFLFFRQAYLQGTATLRPMLDLLPWVLLFLVPAATMRALSEDIRSGTLEVVLAQPLTEVQLLGGKYVGQVLFLWIAVALTIPIVVGLSFGADLHAGVIVAQYVGAALLVAGLAAVGVWASSITRNQITAFIVGLAVMFPLILVGLNPLIVGLPPALSQVAQSLGVLTHFENIARGVIDLRDAVYFITLAGVFLTFAYLALMRRKLAHGGPALRRLQLGTALLAVALVVVNLFGRHIGGRVDLTPNNAYTLSNATKDILGALDDIVTIKLFVSDELPTQFVVSRRDVEDLLRDFRSAGGDNLRVVQVTPANDEEAEQEAQQIGIPPVQFNVYGEAEFQIKSGYFGLAVQYADGTETIPFIERTDDLEYQLVSAIRSLTRTEQSVVGLVTESDPRDQRGGFQTLRAALQEGHDVRSLTPNDSTPIADDIEVLVVAGSPMFLSDSQAQRYTAFLERGGGMLVLARGAQMQQQQLMAQSFPPAWNRVLEPYGVTIRGDLAFDLSSNEAVSMGGGVGGFRILVNYPFWMRVLSTREAVINRDIEVLLMPWASTIDTSEAAAGTVTPLFVTSRAAGSESGRIMIMPQRDFPQDSLGRQLVGVLVNPTAAGDTTLPRGRVVVVGNSEFVTDGMAQGGGAAIKFALNAVDWLAEDESLIAIRAKDRTPPPLVFESETLRDVVKYGNVLGVPTLLILLAALRLLRRKRLTRRTYASAAGVTEAAEAAG